ncbi:formylglycine-generating enzyme family protein [Burkholderia sp. IMCC1007]|uniref:formylglycine-generating enzyme family protein n=1 Tax=Burkholderia sp. IMCC1007 TaxID=3004104 RepID=UPI0022B37B19|nr:SUMF1/EgtB/PvdO family nonheme iron enzyme [Burkholderia sp. IMCC1007]
MSDLRKSLRGKPKRWVIGGALLLSSVAMAASDTNAPPDKERLIREITTPSPPHDVWEHISVAVQWTFGKVHDDTIRILQDYFRSLPAPTDTELADFRRDIAREWVAVKGGTFLMGDFGPEKSAEKQPYSANDGAAPAHDVTLDSYSILKHRVTYAQYDIYTRANHLPPIMTDSAFKFQFRFPDFPAGDVTWKQARDFCTWLGKELNAPVDLPTEAQWEYAARSRGELWVIPSKAVPVVDGKYGLTDLDDTIVRMGRDKSPTPSISRPVGTYGDNSIGMSDVFGYGREWTYDWFDQNYYSRSPKANPRGPATGTLRSVRNGTDSRVRLVIDRRGEQPDKKAVELGFRCALNQGGPAGP